MTSLDLVISNYLNCDRRELYEKLGDTSIHSKVVRHFEGRLLVTTYKNKEGKYKEFILKDVSYKGADEQYAYNGFMDMTVKQHFFARHEIKLRFPFNPCAIEITGKSNQHHNYFPLETVKLVPYSQTNVPSTRQYITDPFYQKNYRKHNPRHKFNRLKKQRRNFEPDDFNDAMKDLTRQFRKMQVSSPSLNDKSLEEPTSINEKNTTCESISLGSTTASEFEYGDNIGQISTMDCDDSVLEDTMEVSFTHNGEPLNMHL